MVKGLEELLLLCDNELKQREYREQYYLAIKHQWAVFKEWMHEKGITEFNEDIATKYLQETLGYNVNQKKISSSLRLKRRAIRLLVSYQLYGDFEFRCPNVQYSFANEIGEVALLYLEHCKNDLKQADSTIKNKELYLFNLCSYMNLKKLKLEELSVNTIEDFYSTMNYSLASRHNAGLNFKNFLRYAYFIGKTTKDNSVLIPADNYKRHRNLPTTYEESEIKEIINAIDRSSAIGKRDYLVILLAAEYGWRAKDITMFSFKDIDWDNNVIAITQSKTKKTESFPLLSNIGNAIVDYLKYSRPVTDVPEIIVSLENVNKGKPLASPTIHSIVTRYMRCAGIKNWQNKKHGPHSMRHSLATNLLKKNISLPVISTVLGHQSTETTKIYISLDDEKLKQCVLEIPIVHSQFYREDTK